MRAAYAGVAAWARFWWWPTDGALEARCGANAAGKGVPRYRLVSNVFSNPQRGHMKIAVRGFAGKTRVFIRTKPTTMMAVVRRRKGAMANDFDSLERIKLKVVATSQRAPSHAPQPAKSSPPKHKCVGGPIARLASR